MPMPDSSGGHGGRHEQAATNSCDIAAYFRAMSQMIIEGNRGTFTH